MTTAMPDVFRIFHNDHTHGVSLMLRLAIAQETLALLQAESERNEGRSFYFSIRSGGHPASDMRQNPDDFAWYYLPGLTSMFQEMFDKYSDLLGDHRFMLSMYQCCLDKMVEAALTAKSEDEFMAEYDKLLSLDQTWNDEAEIPETLPFLNNFENRSAEYGHQTTNSVAALLVRHMMISLRQHLPGGFSHVKIDVPCDTPHFEMVRSEHRKWNADKKGSIYISDASFNAVKRNEAYSARPLVP